MNDARPLTWLAPAALAPALAQAAPALIAALPVIGLAAVGVFALAKLLEDEPEQPAPAPAGKAEAGPRRVLPAPAPAAKLAPISAPVKPAPAAGTPAAALGKLALAPTATPARPLPASAGPVAPASATVAKPAPISAPVKPAAPVAPATTPTAPADNPQPFKPRLSVERLAAIFTAGPLERSAAVAALIRAGLGKSAAYAALRPESRFAAHLATLPDGRLAWQT